MTQIPGKGPYQLYDGPVRTANCSTCEIVSELSGGFTDLTPQVEAIYIEHLYREHAITP